MTLQPEIFYEARDDLSVEKEKVNAGNFFQLTALLPSSVCCDKSP